MHAKPGEIVDHINRKRFDNRKKNLRVCQYSENDRNRGLYSTNKSGVSGVHFDKRRSKWVAAITYNRKKIFIGRFISKDDAIDNLAKELSSGIISVIVFIAIFFIVRIILALVKIVAKIIDKIPGLKQINKLGGGICGAIEGLIMIYAILAILSMISPIISNTVIIEQIYNSNIGSLMYNNNLILKSIYKI